MSADAISGQPLRVAVLGVVRNGEQSLHGAVQRIAAALPSAWSVRWVVVESDSDDATVALLQQLGSTVPGFWHRSLGRLRDGLPGRTARIAHCRNVALEALQALAPEYTPDYVVVADLDGVNDGLTQQALLSCWQREDWDACGANQDGPYYDLWALRHPHWCPGDCWAEAAFLAEHGVEPERARLAAVYARMLHISREHNWIEVDSAFGGLAVYRSSALLGLHYEGVTADGTEVCEHVALHRQLRARGGRIYINPALINGTAGDDATYWPGRAAALRTADSLRLRTALRLFFGEGTAKELRRLIKSVL